jgi:Family of unknown function (DUF6118)
MEQENVAAANIDAAAMAFDELRSEVLTLRLAIQRLAAAPSEIEIPDYTETLVEMTANFNAVARGMKALKAAPVLELTPEALAKQIADAGATARRAEQESLASSKATFVKLGSEMAGFLASARTENEQNKWVLGFGGLCLTFGLVAATILPDPIYRAAPEGWHWPERRAANVLDRDMWEAGERLQAIADYKRWKESSILASLSDDSRSRIAACLNATTKGKAPISCEVGIKSQAQRRSFR